MKLIDILQIFNFRTSTGSDMGTDEFFDTKIVRVRLNRQDDYTGRDYIEFGMYSFDSEEDCSKRLHYSLNKSLLRRKVDFINVVKETETSQAYLEIILGRQP